MVSSFSKDQFLSMIPSDFLCGLNEPPVRRYVGWLAALLTGWSVLHSLLAIAWSEYYVPLDLVVSRRYAAVHSGGFDWGLLSLPVNGVCPGSTNPPRS